MLSVSVELPTGIEIDENYIITKLRQSGITSAIEIEKIYIPIQDDIPIPIEDDIPIPIEDDIDWKSCFTGGITAGLVIFKFLTIFF